MQILVSRKPPRASHLKVVVRHAGQFNGHNQPAAPVVAQVALVKDRGGRGGFVRGQALPIFVVAARDDLDLRTQTTQVNRPAHSAEVLI